MDYDVNTSFFGVYDGHGGHEVSQYCAEKLPEFIKNTEAYKAGDIERALVDGYLEFDGTLVKEDVVQQLKRIAQDKSSGVSEITVRVICLTVPCWYLLIIVWFLVQ